MVDSNVRIIAAIIAAAASIVAAIISGISVKKMQPINQS